MCVHVRNIYIVSEERQQWSKRRLYGLVGLFVAGSRRDMYYNVYTSVGDGSAMSMMINHKRTTYLRM